MTKIMNLKTRPPSVYFEYFGETDRLVTALHFVKLSFIKFHLFQGGGGGGGGGINCEHICFLCVNPEVERC